MADIYVRSTDGSDSDNGSTWALAKATLAGAAAIDAAGDTVYVSQAHAGSASSSTTYALAGTPSNPVRVLCVNDAAEPPTALATTATITTTGTSSITITGSAYVYGLTMNTGTGTGSSTISLNTAAAASIQSYEQCAFNAVSTGTNGHVYVNADGIQSQRTDWRNCNLSFANTASRLRVCGEFNWRGGSLTAGVAVPNALLTFRGASSDRPALARTEGVDLSQLGSGKALVDLASFKVGEAWFIDCKLGSAVSATTGSWEGPGGHVYIHNSDSADTNYRREQHGYEGSVYTETTVVRTGGATIGSTGVSFRMVSSANARYPMLPLRTFTEGAIWSDATGSSKTVTLEVVTDGVTLKDDECWLEVSYLGTSGVPLATLASDAKAGVLTTAANQASSSVGWTTTGLSSPVKQKLEVSFTPQEVGAYRIAVVLAKPSTTVYFCPAFTVT